MLDARGQDTIRVTKGKGHAEEADVELGPAPAENRLGHIEADTAVDLGRRHQSEAVMGARQALVIARELWYSHRAAASSIYSGYLPDFG